MLLCCLAASADAVQIDGIWYNLVEKAKVAEVTNAADGGNYAGDVVIPSTVIYGDVAYSVTGIGIGAFNGCSNLTSITLPESVKSIGESAFWGCSKLTSVTLSEGLEDIGRYAFRHCSKLPSIVLPEGVTIISLSAFEGCSNLTSITIPASVTTIESSAFSGCIRLASVYICSIESWCSIKFMSTPFVYAKNLYLNGELATELTIPSSVAIIEDNAFYNCSSITSVTISEGVAGVGVKSFNKCTNLASVALPASVESLGIDAFNGCSKLASITIPEDSKLKKIGKYAFSGCSSLTSIAIPNCMTNIMEYSFQNCSSLTAVSLPTCIESIEGSAFEGCSSLTSITIPKGVTSIGSRAFNSCSNLATITIPASVVRIEQRTFSGCSSLANVVLQSTAIEYIGNEAFANCSDLTDFYCNTEKVPNTNTAAFKGSYPEYATLHVPSNAVESYKATAPWNSFGAILGNVNELVMEITLNHTLATLFVGEQLQLVASITPDCVADSTLIWSSDNEDVAIVSPNGEVAAIGYGTAIITAAANDGSGVSASCEVKVVRKLPIELPVVRYIGGKVVFTCETEGAVVHTNIVVENDLSYQGLEFDFVPTYTITAYVVKDNSEKSEEVTFTLCWIVCDDNHEDVGEPGDGIINIPSKVVLIQSQNGIITLSGLAEGAEVAVYDTTGVQLAIAIATDGTATLSTNLTAGTSAIVKIADQSIKVVVK